MGKTILEQIEKLNTQITFLQKEVMKYRELKPRNLINRMRRVELDLIRLSNLNIENMKRLDKIEAKNK